MRLFFGKKKPPAIPKERYQLQENEMGRFMIDTESGEVIREVPLKLKDRPLKETIGVVGVTVKTNEKKKRNILIAKTCSVLVNIAICIYILGWETTFHGFSAVPEYLKSATEKGSNL